MFILLAQKTNFVTFVQFDCSCQLCKKVDTTAIPVPAYSNPCTGLQQSLYRPTAIPVLAYSNPWGCQEFDAPRFQDNGAHECRKVNPTFHPSLPPWNIHGTHFCQRLSRTQRHSTAGRIKTMTNCNNSIEPATFRLVAQSLGQLPHRHCLLSSVKKTVWCSSVTKCCDGVNIRGQTQLANLTNVTTEFQ